MEHSADMGSGESHNKWDTIDEHVTARSGPSPGATGRIASVPAHRKKASRSNAKHVRQERVDRGDAIAGWSNTAGLRPENRCRDVGVEGRQGKPAALRMPRRCWTACHEDRAAVVEIDGVSVMVWRWFVDRGAAGDMIGCLIVMGMAMASWNAIIILMMAGCMAVAVIMSRHMDMRPIGMPRSLGERLVRMRNRSPTEKQMCVHDHYEE